ncbi:MAG: hypothetical protein CMC55_07100 [Flavobacteriaceae bacterium]|jgi:hypothetical protein|nr:hypothetical protein [Flavobacteriaceae bacterium]
MADLTVTITEAVTLNSSNRGSTNSVTTTGISDCLERIVTCINGNVTTIATFGAQPYSSAGALDVDRAKYIRITNLDANGWIEVGIVTTATNYQVLLTPGNSHILCQAEAVALAEADTDPSFGTLENLTAIEVQPVGVSYDPRVEIFVAVAE